MGEVILPCLALFFFILALFFSNRYYYLNFFINKNTILINLRIIFFILKPLYSHFLFGSGYFSSFFIASNSTIILVLPITEYFFTTNCFLLLYSPATTISIPSSTSARKFKLCAAIKQFSLSKENRTKGVLLIFNIRIFETTPFIVFTLIASISLNIIATICFT